MPFISGTFVNVNEHSIDEGAVPKCLHICYDFGTFSNILSIYLGDILPRLKAFLFYTGWCYETIGVTQEEEHTSGLRR